MDLRAADSCTNIQGAMSELQSFLTKRGAVSELARGLGITHGAIVQWRGRVPASRVVEVERLTGIPRESLRPDLYRASAGEALA